MGKVEFYNVYCSILVMQLRETFFIALGVTMAVIVVLSIFELVRHVERTKLSQNFDILDSQTGNYVSKQMLYMTKMNGIPNLSKLV